MAKTKAPAKPNPTTAPREVVIEYDLFALPTAFHKAGLAGLVLLIESLKARNLLKDEDAKYEMTAAAATVRFTEALVRGLLDEVYDAVNLVVAVAKKWDAEVVREATQKEIEAGTPFVYHLLQPKGAFFDNVFDGEKEVWRKLWRQAIWEILRPRDKNRLPYQERLAGTSCNEGAKAWGDLLKVEKARGKNGFHTAELSSALFPGAQAVNAEGVPFEGRAEQNLLLHFWPFVTLLFVPNKVERDGSSDFSGYTLAVPEVGDLPDFVQQFPKLLAALEGKVRGYRPAGAVVDIAAEGGLAFLTHLADVAGVTVADKELRYSIRSVEYRHLIKEGNNIKTMAAGRVSPKPDLLRDYRAIVSPKGKEPIFRNPLFRRGLLLALLDGKAWYEPFLKTFAAFDMDVFIRQPRRSDDADSKAPPQFATDADAKLKHLTLQFTQTREKHMTLPEPPSTPRPLELLVDQVVRSFLLGKAKSKCNIDKKKKLSQLAKEDQKRVYDKKRDVAEEAFLAVRSRRDQDFIKYFTEVICSAGTYFDRRTNDYLDFATALNDPGMTDALKALTLLSLSANS